MVNNVHLLIWRWMIQIFVGNQKIVAKITCGWVIVQLIKFVHSLDLLRLTAAEESLVKS